MEEQKEKVLPCYVHVAIDHKNNFTDTLYTYGCPFQEVAVGDCVQVPFGKGKTLRKAYVFAVSKEHPEGLTGLKQVEALEEGISLGEETMELCRWMHQRYLCRYIDAVKLFLPVGKPPKKRKEKNSLKQVQGEKLTIEKLTPPQQQAIQQVAQALREENPHIFLLHGATGSGKTEVYMQLIQQVVDQGKTAIMLVPEISLTKQIVDRFVGRFGVEQLAVFHSRLTPSERYDQWKRVASGQVPIVVGARSAVFAPLKNIGLIVLDEEHETTYKSDMSPKYDTLEIAIKRTKPAGGSVLLGSATPSVVSYQRAQEGIYTLLTLPERYNKVPLPHMIVADMREELTAGNRTMLSRRLFQEMAQTLDGGEQVILFMNRRGYSTFVSCRACGHVATCPKCGISLTYHRGEGKLVCHYCDYKEPLPHRCPRCQSPFIKGFGGGTEKVMELVEELFPEYPAARLDVDAMKEKGALQKVLTDFGKGKIKILVGTQVVAKGLDFPHVGLVGIVSSDVMLHVPEYRAPERAFQLIAQAAGRAGRGDKQGKVVVQSYQPEHYAIQKALHHDYTGFFMEEMKRRQALQYPPFADIIQVVFSGKKEKDLEEGLARWRQTLLDRGAPPWQVVAAGSRVYLREEALYRGGLLIKSLPGEKEEYMAQLAILKEGDREERKNYSVVVDVNPYTLWRN